MGLAAFVGEGVGVGVGVGVGDGLATAGPVNASVRGLILPGLGDPGLTPLGFGAAVRGCFGSGGGGFSASEIPADFRQTW